MGHGPARIARALGVSQTTIRELVRGDARTISPQLRDAITALYDAWWDKRAPERTRAERAAAAAARRRAIAGNWCAGAALDDDQLDIPGYRPRTGWRPAPGTEVTTTSARRGQPHGARRVTSTPDATRDDLRRHGRARTPRILPRRRPARRSRDRTHGDLARI